MKKIGLIAMILALMCSMSLALSSCCGLIPNEQGEQGIQGEKGEQGEPGEKGDKGDQGEPGEKGDKGDKGDPGETGAQGEPGQDGAKGDKGDIGATGATIAKVELNGDGNLVITLTDGTVLDPVELPEKIDGEHSFGEPLAVFDSDYVTCDNQIYISICSDCNELRWEKGTAEDHKLTTVAAKDPTCTEVGWNEHQKCENCIYSTAEYIDSLGHDEVYHAGQSATCTEIGWYDYETCTRCDYSTYWEISAYGHSKNYHSAKDPTCTEVGWDAYETCYNCDYTTYNELAIVPHKLMVNSDGTLGSYKATNDSYYPFEYDSVTGILMSTNHYDSTSSTYTITATGSCLLKIQYKTSSESNYDNFIISLNGYGVGEVISGETGWYELELQLSAGDVLTFRYSKDGSQSNGSDCAYFTIDVIGEYTDVTDELLSTLTPYCTEDICCAICGEVLVAKLGESHDVVTHEAKAPACTEIGWDAYETCTRCDYTTYSEKAALGHDEKYVHNENEHWLECTRCDLVGESDEHTVGDDGFCTVCDRGIEPTEGVVYLVSNDGTYAEVIDYTGSSARVIIASEYNGVPVTHIGADAFKSKPITAIYIPDSVTTICENAFYNCSSLTSIEIPDSVTSIGDYAFRDCSSLTSIVIPDSVTSIGSSAFQYCDGLTSITIPDSVTSIGSSAFYDCDGLTSITIPDSVTSIGSSAFQYCSRLTSVTIGNGVTSIGGGAFYDCYSLTSITIPNSVTSIGGGAFYDCDRLIEIENGVSYVDTWVIDFDNTAASVTLREGTRGIADSAFSEGTKLRTISIPDTVTSIGSSAFSGCTSLLYNEYDNAYYLGNENNPYIVLIKAKDTSITSCEIYSGTKAIYYSAFYNCDGLTSITIPDSVISIGSSAFYMCTRLTSITIPDSVTSIGDYAFISCTSLTSITIPDSVTSIGNYALRYCSRLTSIKYRGTEKQWNAISKGSGWNSDTGNYTITYNYTGE